MSIKRMLLLASMSLAAIALAAPAAAQANVTLTETGKPLAKGALVTATGINLITTVGENTLNCNKVTLHYEVSVNGHKHVVLRAVPNSITDNHNGTAEECVVETPIGTFQASIPTAGTGDLTINTWGQGTTKATFTSEVPAFGQHCSYTGEVHIDADENGGDTATVTPSTLHDEAEVCEHGVIEGGATLETPDGHPVTIDYVATP